MAYRLINADVLEGLGQLDSESVHCVVTSPPYWGLRDYGVDGQLGLETTPEEYVARMVEVFSEVRRVLRPDGTLWLNMGDSYTDSGRGDDTGSTLDGSRHSQAECRKVKVRETARTGLAPKQLMGMPWRLALALQSDGWWLRSDIIWHKPNPMPESVTDRPTKAHEYLFLLAKSRRYFYDAEAISEPAGANSHPRGRGVNPKCVPPGQGIKQNEEFSGAITAIVSRRNKRTVWTINTQAYPEAHFATFPSDLVAPCIKAGSSEQGVCSGCGAPWIRQTEKIPTGKVDVNGWDTAPGTHGREKRRKWDAKDKQSSGRRIIDNIAKARAAGADHDNPFPGKRTVGWAPGCACGAEPGPATVLDPFTGSGTAGEVALRLGRDFLGIELNAEYCALAEPRLEAAQKGLTVAEVKDGQTSLFGGEEDGDGK